MLELGRAIPEKSRILVAMSGGVDSSVTAVLLRRAGYEVVGVKMFTSQGLRAGQQSWLTFDAAPRLDDTGGVRALTARENIPLYSVNVSAEFEEKVVRPFVDSYLCGQTPNPCVVCNNTMKFGLLLDQATDHGCYYIATGHYARVAESTLTGRMELRRPADASKDQTYYLFGLRQEQLRRFITPLGGLLKTQVREIARDLGLPMADQEESQEICFVPDNDYRKFLASRVESCAIHPGDIVTTDGKVVGRHSGVAFYTVGQRRGLGIAHSEPLYVVALMPQENLVVVGTKEETLRDSLTCGDTNWTAIEPPSAPLQVHAQIRYRHSPTPAEIAPLGGGRYEVRFFTSQRAVTPGQAVVFYRGDTVLGGGWILPHPDAEA